MQAILAPMPDIVSISKLSKTYASGFSALKNVDLTIRRGLETSDHPAEEIVKYATAHNVDLIVMGTHGRGAIAQLLVGSVAERVVRTAPCPVLTGFPFGHVPAKVTLPIGAPASVAIDGARYVLSVRDYQK